VSAGAAHDSGSGTRREEATVRLFWALDAPGPTLDLVEAWQRSQAGIAGSEALRPIPRQALHLTLAFLGERPERDVAAIAAVAEDLASTPIPASLRPDPCPIPAGRPRLLALEVESRAAEQLQAELAARLLSIGAYEEGHEPDRRPFWPHLTVFRLRRSSPRDGARRPLPRLGSLPPGDRGGDGHAFGFVRVSLYRSRLRPEGASYSRLAANELPQQGGRQKR
jgi:2'-5' RNA ligase